MPPPLSLERAAAEEELHRGKPHVRRNQNVDHRYIDELTNAEAPPRVKRCERTDGCGDARGILAQEER